MDRFIHHNTDGPFNPFSRVYTVDLVRRDFSQFHLEKSKVHFLNERHFPGIKLLPRFFVKYLSRKFGWHLWTFMSKKNS